jgi:hypothetical protein
MFRFMMSIFLDTIYLAFSMKRTLERFKGSSDLHERLAAVIRVYVQRQERRAWLKSNRSAPVERTEGLAVPGH